MRANPITTISAVVFASLLLIYAFPIVPPDILHVVADSYAQIVLLVMTILALQYGLHGIVHREEKRFWRLLTAALSLWFLVDCTRFAFHFGIESAWFNSSLDLIQTLSYFCVAIAMEQNPHLRAGWSRQTAAPPFTIAGTALFVAGLFTYFVFIALRLDAETAPSVPSSLLFIVFDLYLACRLVYSVATAGSARWRILYGVLLAAFGCWCVSDTINMLFYAKIQDFSLGTPLDWFFYVPFGAIILASHLRYTLSSPIRRDAPAADSLAQEAPNPLIAYAIAFPLIHFAIEAAGLLGPGSRQARVILVLATLLALVGLTMVQRIVLARMRRKTRGSDPPARDRALHAQRLAAVGQLTGGVAHDFNNVLLVINGYSDLLLQELRGSDRLREYVESIREAAGRAGVLTKQLLNFSRKRPPEHRRLNINTEVQHTRNMLQRLIGEDIELITDLDPELGLVRADAGQLAQVIVNLAVNARAAMPDGGRFILRTRNASIPDTGGDEGTDAPPGDYAVLEAIDSGIGMDTATSARIFEPFFSTKPDGTGLGLATVHGIVTQSNGYMQVKTAPGAGTVFTIHLPVADAVSTDAEVEPPGEPPGANPTETVLLVEDEEPVREVARACLDRYGYRVLEARDASEALQISSLHEGPVQLLLTDVLMPGLNGRELAERLTPQRNEMRVLFMSGHPDDTLLGRGRFDSRADFLRKPFSLEALRLKVREVLDAEPRSV